MQLCMFAFFNDLVRREGAAEAVRFARECGFAEIEMLHALRPGARPVFKTWAEVEELRRELDAAGMRCACYSVSVNVLATHLGECGDRSAVDELKRCADIAKALGSPFLHHTLTIGYVPECAERDSLDAILPELVERACEVAEYANSIGLTVLYEPQGYYVNGLEGFGKFYACIKQKGLRIGVCGDMGNSLYVNCPPDAFFARYANEIMHVHLKDFVIEDAVLNRENAKASRSWDKIRDGRMITEARLGEGMVDMDACMAHLRRVGYAGAYATETFYWNNLTVSLRENLARDCTFMLEKYSDDQRSGKWN